MRKTIGCCIITALLVAIASPAIASDASGSLSTERRAAVHAQAPADASGGTSLAASGIAASSSVGTWGFEAGMWPWINDMGWSVIERRASVGNLAAYCSWGYDTQYSNYSNYWLTTGPLDLSGYGKATLSFDLWLDCEPDYADYLFAGASGDDMDYYGEAFSGNTGGWVPVTVDISEYCGDPSVWLAFQFVSDETVVAEGAYVDNIRLDASPAVYRFYNFTNGTHFFTPSAGERDMVIAKWPNIFSYEGIAYCTDPANNTQPLYRFYNRRSQSHFYTADPGEAQTILAKWPDIFTLDGQTYAVNPGPVPNSIPVHRFFNLKNGSHFYTASVDELDHVKATLSSVYQYEGIAFWLGQ